MFRPGWKTLVVTISILILVNRNHVWGQETVDNQLWLNYALSVRASENFSYGGDAGFRGFISNQDWNQILIRPTATYRFNRIVGVAGAVAWFGTFNVDEDNVNEFRIHQDFNINWPNFGYVDFFYRLRIEERFFFYQNGSNEFNLRIRNLVGVESQDFRLGQGKKPFYFQVIFETFKTVGDDSSTEVFVNQTRTHAAFGHRISPRFRYELHYIWQKSRLLSDDGLKTSQNIFRLRTFHTIPLKKDR